MGQASLNVEDLLQVGQSIKLWLPVYGQDRAVNTGVPSDGELRDFDSRILKLLPTEIVVVWPTELEPQTQVFVGQQVILETKHDWGLARLDSLLARVITDPVLAWHIARSDCWSVRQLRLNVRMNVSLVDSETLLVARGPEKSGHNRDGRPLMVGGGLIAMRGGEPIEAIIRDLSAGGVLLASTTRLEQESLVKLSFALTGKDRSLISALARVAWAGEERSNVKYRYRAGCQFLNLRTGEQDRIVRFIFAKQAEWRRWGLV